MLSYLHLTREETNHSAPSALEACLLTYVVEFPEIKLKKKTPYKWSAARKNTKEMRWHEASYTGLQTAEMIGPGLYNDSF